jgi:hypothetical protein
MDQMPQDPQPQTPPPAHTGEPHHTPVAAAGSKLKISFNGIDWKKEIMNAIEILKMNKTKMHEIAKDEKATTVGLSFILVPQIISLIIAIVGAGGFMGYLHGSYILGGVANFGFVSFYNIGLILPFLFIYGVHLVSTKFFQGKGDMWGYFRVVSYVFAASIISTLLLLIMTITSADLIGLANLVNWAIFIVALVVSYFWMMEGYHMTQQNAIIAPIVSMVVAGLIIWLVSSVLFPNPFADLANQLSKYSNGLR